MAFHELVKEKPKGEKMRLAQEFEIDFGEYKRRIKGKEKENELVAIMKSLGVLKHLYAYDESLSHLTGEATPEWNIIMHDDYKMMMEVKSTDKEEFKISSGNLQKRIDFAERHDMPLRFAISIKGYWGLFTSETLQRKKGKLRVGDFFRPSSSSWFDRELSTCSYMFLQSMRIRNVYSTNTSKGSGIIFPPYGNLISSELYCGDKQLIRIKGQNDQFYRYAIGLSALKAIMPEDTQNIEQDGEFTVITNEIKEGSICPEYRLILYFTNHTLGENGERYTTDSMVSEKGAKFFPVNTLRFQLNELFKLGLPIAFLKDSVIYDFNGFEEIMFGSKADDN